MHHHQPRQSHSITLKGHNTMTTHIVRDETTVDNTDIGNWLDLDEAVAALDIRTWVLRMLAGGIGAGTNERILFTPAAVTHLTDLLAATVPGYGDIPPAPDMQPVLVHPEFWGDFPAHTQPEEAYYWTKKPEPGTLALRAKDGDEGHDFYVAPAWTESTIGEPPGIQCTEVGEVVAAIVERRGMFRRVNGRQ